jgi:hypothetical protein
VYWASAWSRFLFRTCSRFGGSTLIGEACEDSWVFWRWSSLKVVRGAGCSHALQAEQVTAEELWEGGIY